MEIIQELIPVKTHFVVAICKQTLGCSGTLFVRLESTTFKWPDRIPTRQEVLELFGKHNVLIEEKTPIQITSQFLHKHPETQMVTGMNEPDWDDSILKTLTL